ncbi:MAG: AAA family ATPase [Chlorobiaceae bacterium]
MCHGNDLRREIRELKNTLNSSFSLRKSFTKQEKWSVVYQCQGIGRSGLCSHRPVPECLRCNIQHRKPLILRGARQVGKTWSLKEFGKSRFESLALVDLERNNPLRQLHSYPFKRTPRPNNYHCDTFFWIQSKTAMHFCRHSE